MSKTAALRELKQARKTDTWVYVAAIRPDVRTTAKVRRALKRRMMMKKELMKP